jgi:hypothetical protein
MKKMANIAEFARNIKSAVVARTPLSQETRLSLQEINESIISPKTRIVDVLSHQRGNCLTETKLADESNKSKEENYRYVEGLIFEGTLKREMKSKDGIVYEQICLTDRIKELKRDLSPSPQNA